MKRLLGSAVIAFVIPYLLIAFVAWDLNPGNWSEHARLFFALCWPGAFVAAVIYPGWDD